MALFEITLEHLGCGILLEEAHHWGQFREYTVSVCFQLTLLGSFMTKCDHPVSAPDNPHDAFLTTMDPSLVPKPYLSYAAYGQVFIAATEK